MKRKIILFFSMVLAMCFMALLVPRRTEAANYTAEKVSTGKFKVVDRESGKSIAVIKVDKDHVDSVYVTAKNIYFTASAYEKSSNINKSSLYCYSRETKKTKYLKYLGNKYYSYGISYVYGKSLYLTGAGNLMPAGWYSDGQASFRYFLSTNKLKQLTDKGGVRDGYINYVIMGYSGGGLGFGDFPIYIYDTKSGKTKTLTNGSVRYKRNEQYIYYAVVKTTKEHPYYWPISYSFKHTVVRYNLLTGKKKAIATGLSANWIGEMTSKNIYYTLGADSKTAKYYRYDVAAKKSVQVPKSSYLEY